MLGGEGDGVVDRVVPLAELAGHPDDGREALVRGLVGARAPGYLQVRVAVEPDLLELADEVGYLLAGVQVAAHVERPELERVLLPEVRLGCKSKTGAGPN